MDLNDMLKEAQKLQKDMEDIQQKLENEEFPVSNDDGTVTVTLTGSSKLKSLVIKESLKNGPLEGLQREVLKTFQKGIETARKKHEEAMKKITASLSLPSLDEIKSMAQKAPVKENRLEV